jgi:N-methylhydantoinase B
MSVTADPITTEVVRNFVISCAEDMNASLWRSAHSSVIYGGKDSAVALMDEHGNMLGQSTGVPLFIGAIDACVHRVKAYYGDDIHEGDVFIMNDSYLQGTHLHDVTAIGGIFRDGELVGFGAPAPIGATVVQSIPARPCNRPTFTKRGCVWDQRVSSLVESRSGNGMTICD